MILDSSKIKITPIQSVFVRGWKCVIRKSPITTTNYHYISLVHTGNPYDIVCGYLAEVDDNTLESIDIYEGNSYKRIEVTVFTRNMEERVAYTYIGDQR